jgi:hypothetical protein
MKKLVSIIVVILAVTYNTNGQSKLAFGVKAGANYSNVYDSKGEDFNADPKFGLVTGAFLSIPLGKFIGVQPEVLFSQKGFKATGTMLGSPYDLVRTTSYIDVPLLVSVTPIESITILAGPQFSFLMKQRDKFNGPTTNFDQEEEFENDNLRKNTLCFTGGADFNLDHTVISLRTGWDLSNNNGNGTSSTPRYKNVWVQAAIGYRFYN